ncbi:hypothetical protein OJF2_16650 [Aquisphaera giovannonii]|uniref:Uncharacterized protein n=1 Tax=Aquisphaera giovannonii TaxID=406548 RepID=A0A5B9VXY3_9BACT|nr:hypothetical protein [Aquisphaera giovannonii]QEH33168.1 hypothetical protein OJF2_16650 [Aquisphaera giovannonii]
MEQPQPNDGPGNGETHDFNLRPKSRTGPLHRDSARFHVFLVDTGWNAPVSKVLHEHVHLFHRYHPQDPLYILTREQSIALLKHAPDHIGLDPMVIMYDMYRPAHMTKKLANYHGFRLNLGVFKNPQQAASKLQEFLKFVAKNREAECLSDEVARELHREGMSNVVKLLREASEASLEIL